MYKVLLKKIYINNDLQIYFNTGENYIIGKNNTGKTTIFNLIQYLFGIKKTVQRSPATYGAIKEPYIECQFGSKVYKISRKIGSNEITFEGDINETVKVGSYELNILYTKLLNINFNNDNNNNANSSIDILKMSFLSEIELSKTFLNKGNNYYKILGYDEEYLNVIKKDINNLKDELKFEIKSLKIIEQYKRSVEKSLFTIKSKVGKNYEEITQVLEKEFSEISNNFLENNKLLRYAEEIYENELTVFNIGIEKEIIELNPYFQNTIKEILPRNSNFHELELKNVIEMKNSKNLSIGERIILLFALYVTLCRNEIQNGLGILITDSIFPNVDTITMKGIRNKLDKVTKNGELQYIEFCTDNTYIPKDSVVFEFPSKRGGGIFD